MTTDRRNFLLAVARVSAATGTMALGIPGARAQKSDDRIRKIKVLAFDSYGSLFDVKSLDSACEQAYPGAGKELSTLWRAKQLQYSQMRSQMNRYRDFWLLTDDALVHATNSLRLPLSADTRRQLTASYLTLPLYPDVKPAMEALKKQGVRLVLLSNGTAKMLEAVARNSGIDGLIEQLISVDEVKVFKPDPRVYQLAVDKLKTGTDELGFVSSHSWDVNGAASFGLPTFWVPRQAQDAPDELGYQATRTLKSMAELAPLLLRG